MMAADLLKDLPSRDSAHFSQYSQGSFKNTAAQRYVKLRVEGEEERAQVIQTDQQCMIRREMERLQQTNRQHQSRKHSLSKRDSSEEEQQTKHRRTDQQQSSTPEPD